MPFCFISVHFTHWHMENIVVFLPVIIHSRELQESFWGWGLSCGSVRRPWEWRESEKGERRVGEMKTETETEEIIIWETAAWENNETGKKKLPLKYCSFLPGNIQWTLTPSFPDILKGILILPHFYWEWENSSSFFLQVKLHKYAVASHTFLSLLSTKILQLALQIHGFNQTNQIYTFKNWAWV